MEAILRRTARNVSSFLQRSEDSTRGECLHDVTKRLLMFSDITYKL